MCESNFIERKRTQLRCEYAIPFLFILNEIKKNVAINANNDNNNKIKIIIEME